MKWNKNGAWDKYYKCPKVAYFVIVFLQYCRKYKRDKCTKDLLKEYYTLKKM